MTKAKQPDPIEYPKVLYAAYEAHGTDDQYMVVGPDHHSIVDQDQGEQSVTIARYVLAGTGTIQHSAPVYVEDAKA